jgi:hypothetical protein
MFKPLMLLLLTVGFVSSTSAPPEVWRLVPDLRIGALDGPAAFGRVVDVEVAPDGRMFVADRRSLRISIFAPDGTFLGGFGRSGAGPGEFRDFSRLSLARGGLHVFDLAQMRLSRFSLDGEFLGSWGPPTWGVPPPLQVNAPEVALADGSFLVNPMLMSPYDPVPETPLARYGAARDSLGVLAWLEAGASRIRAETDTWRIGFEPPVHDGTLWDVSPGGQRVILVYRSTTTASGENSFRVMALSPAGDTLLDRTFAYTPEPVDRAAAEARRRSLVDNMVNNRPVTRSDAESLYRQGFPIPPYQAGIDQVRAARDGSIWLRRGAFVKEEADWLVLDESGAMVATLRVPADVEIRRVSRSHVWATTTGEWDEPYVVRYRVVR